MKHRTILIFLVTFTLVCVTTLNVMEVQGNGGLLVYPSNGSAGTEVTVSIDIRAYFFEKFKDAPPQEWYKRDEMWKEYISLRYAIIWNPDISDIDNPSAWIIIGEASVGVNGYLSGYATIPDNSYSGVQTLVAVYEGIATTYFSWWSGTFEVTGDSNGPNGCLIATATYGSELSPQVQFLRAFRDYRVLDTYAGKNFMEVFNSVYYSFSPAVASTIRMNPGLRDGMKILLYPLIGILQVSEGVFSLFSVNPEIAVVIAGFTASSLLAITYIAPWALLFTYFKKIKPSLASIHAIRLLWGGSLFAILIAEIIQIASLMMMATGIFVLATMSFTVLVSMRQLPQFLGKYVRTTTKS